jgi:hypothetical protein
MNPNTQWARKKKGTLLSLPINFHHKWKARMPNVIQMIEHGLTAREIAGHFGCGQSVVSTAVQVHSIGVMRLKQQFRAAASCE